MQIVKQEDQEVSYKQQHHRNADVDLHHVLLPRHLAHDGACLLNTIERDPVLFSNALNYVSLSFEVVAGFVVDVDCGEPRPFNVLKLVVLLVQLVVCSQQLLTHVSLRLEVRSLARRCVHELLFIALGLYRCCVLQELLS